MKRALNRQIDIASSCYFNYDNLTVMTINSAYDAGCVPLFIISIRRHCAWLDWTSMNLANSWHTRFHFAIKARSSVHCDLNWHLIHIRICMLLVCRTVFRKSTLTNLLTNLRCLLSLIVHYWLVCNVFSILSVPVCMERLSCVLAYSVHLRKIAGK